MTVIVGGWGWWWWWRWRWWIGCAWIHIIHCRWHGACIIFCALALALALVFWSIIYCHVVWLQPSPSVLCTLLMINEWNRSDLLLLKSLYPLACIDTILRYLSPSWYSFQLVNSVEQSSSSASFSRPSRNLNFSWRLFLEWFSHLAFFSRGAWHRDLHVDWGCLY